PFCFIRPRLPSKQSLGLFGCLTALAHTLLFAFSQSVKSAVDIAAASLHPTATLRFAPIASHCNPSHGLTRPYIVALCYISMVTLGLVPLLCAKGFFGIPQAPSLPASVSTATSFITSSSNTTPPGQDPPPPETSSSSAAVPRAPRIDTNDIAADGAPPPPPPGNETGTGAAKPPNRSCGWIEWIIALFCKFYQLVAILCKWIAAFAWKCFKLALKIARFVIQPFFFLLGQYATVPIVGMAMYSSEWIATTVSTGSLYVFKNVKRVVDHSFITKFIALFMSWMVIYPFCSFVWPVIRGLASVLLLTLPALAIRVLSFGFRCVIWPGKVVIKFAQGIRKIIHRQRRLVLAILLVGAAAILTLEWGPPALALLHAPRWALRLWDRTLTWAYYTHLRTPMTLFHRGFIRPNSNLLRWLAFSCFALPHYTVQTFESAMSEIAVILQPALELMSLTIEELACIVLPPIGYLALADFLAYLNRRLARRITALERRVPV
ncbi:hypothetical protein B0H13DRAFT_1965708, partial [Mycena leptocephala]